MATPLDEEIKRGLVLDEQHFTLTISPRIPVPSRIPGSATVLPSASADHRHAQGPARGARFVSAPSLLYLNLMSSPRSSSVLVLAVGMAALVSCSSTQVTMRWQDPTITRIRFTKVLSLAITKDPSLRDAAEGELCRHMPLVECKPAYFAIPDSMRSKVDEAKTLTLKEGFDGAVVVRVLDKRERVTYVPPSYGRTFWGYYGYARPISYDPGYYRADEVVLIETSIFSLALDRLLWVGTTETVNPKSLPDLVDDVAKAVRDELLRRDLIPPS